MATVKKYSGKRGTSYRATFSTTVNGVRKRVPMTLPVSSMKEARTMADEIERTMKTAEATPTISKEWWMEQADRMMGALGREPLFCLDILWGDLADEWLLSKTKAGKSTLSTYKAHVRFIHSQDLSKQAVSLVSQDGLQAVMEAFGEGRAEGTTRVFRATLQGIGKLAEKKGLTTGNLASGLELTGDSEGGIERQMYDFGDVMKLRSFFDDSENRGEMELAEFKEWQVLMEISLRGAIRLGDNVKLTSDDLLWENDVLFIRYQAEKTKGKDVFLPVSDFVCERVRGVSGPLFPSLRSKPVGGARGLSKRWIELAEKAGVDPLYKETASGNNSPQKSFHSFRHTCPSWLLAAGVPKERVLAYTGHTDEKILDLHYVHQVKEAMKEDKIAQDNFERTHLRAI